jgi:hypothetical protein
MGIAWRQGIISGRKSATKNALPMHASKREGRKRPILDALDALDAPIGQSKILMTCESHKAFSEDWPALPWRAVLICALSRLIARSITLGRSRRPPWCRR